MERERELELVQALRQGEEEAFNEVFALFNRRLLSFLARLAGNRAVAEDLVEETWLRFVSHAGDLHGQTRIGPWLFTVARNLYVSYCRNRTREQAYTADVAFLWPAMPADTSFDLASLNEIEGRLEEAIASLSPAYREVILLVAVEGMRPADAAKICGLKAECLRQRLSRARKMLAATLHGYIPSEHDEVIR